MRRFIGFRPNPPEEYYQQGAANAPHEAQYEGIVFSDGTVCVRWLTEFGSHSIWKDYTTFYQIHGHPEYGTEIKWLDLEPSLDYADPDKCPKCGAVLSIINKKSIGVDPYCNICKKRFKFDKATKKYIPLTETQGQSTEDRASSEAYQTKEWKE